MSRGKAGQCCRQARPGLAYGTSLDYFDAVRRMTLESVASQVENQVLSWSVVPA